MNGLASLLNGDVLWTSSTWADGGAGTLTNSANMTFWGSSAIDTNTFVQNGVMTIQADSGFNANVTAIAFANSGSLEISTSASTYSKLTIDSNELINNGAGILNFGGAGNGTRTLAANLINNGTVNINANATFSKASGIYTNNGDIVINNKTLTVAGSTFTNDVNGVIFGVGTLVVSGVDFENSGTVSPGLSAGILNITGDYNQPATGALDIEIGGLLAGDDYDQLAITGEAILDGTLYITLRDGFLPSPNDVFEIMTYGLHTGEFTSVIGLNICGRHSFDIVYGENSVTIETVSTEIPADFDGDDIVGTLDLFEFGSNWLGLDCTDPNWCGCADLNYGGQVDFFDFAKFADYWLSGY